MPTSTKVLPVSFIIETRCQGGDAIVTWRLDQRLRNPSENRSWDRLYTQVQGHLHELYTRTGFDYAILYWGTHEDADFYVNSNGIKLH